MSFISWLQSPSTMILKPKKIKFVTVYVVSPSIRHEVMGPDAMIFTFWMWKASFFTLLLTFIKRLFSSSSLSVIRVVSPACLSLLIFLLAILIPAWVSPTLAFHIMYSTSSRSWWWTGKPGMLQSMVSQRVRHNWETELNWTTLHIS